ncbi:MAG: AsmA family protein [Betaproteobacteria bacterium]
MRVIKYLLLGIGALVVVVGGVLAYVAATFDPNQYKPQIVQAVKEKTQRTLTLAGDIELSLFPGIGARLGKAALSERGSTREFAAVEDLRFSVKLWPLLSREVVVDAVEIKGLRAHIVRYKDGRTNYDDLAGAPPPGKPGPQKPVQEAGVKVDIARVTVADSAVTYLDQAGGANYEITRLNVKTGRIASGVPSDVEVSLLARGNQPRINIESTLKTRVTFDPGQQRLLLEGLDFGAKGSAAGVTDLAANARGNVEARLASNEFIASKLAVTAKGKQEGQDVGFKLDMPRLSATRDKVSGDRILLDASLAAGKRKISARVEVPAIEGSAKTFRAGQITASLEMQEEGTSTRVKLTSPLAGSIERQHFELPKLAAAINVTNPRLPKSPIDATVNGALALDLAKKSASLTFATKFDESTINGRAGLAKFAPPSYTFDVNIDRLDMDRYLPKSAAAKEAPGTQPKGGPPSGEQPIDLSALKDLNANGTLRIGSLKVSNVKTSNVRLDVKAAGGRMEINPVAANLYQGSLAGALTVDAKGAPTFVVRQKLTGINVGPLLQDLAENDMLEGKGNVALDLTAQGNTVAALKKALNGTTAVRLTDGALKGINIAASIRSAKAKLGVLRGEQVQQANKTEKTDFSELSGTFNIKNGVAHNNDLAMKSPLLRVGGEGTINIGNDSIDYLIKASIVGTTKGQGGRELADLQGVTVPVRVAGPLDAPSYKLDFAALATDAAKQKLEATVRDQLEKRLGGGSKEGKSGGGLGDTLKGLFGR